MNCYEIINQSCLADINCNCNECLARDGVNALYVLEINHLNVVNTCEWLGLKV